MDEPKKSTKEKILDAAEAVFAKNGYAGATVREICDLAGANVASVNYYFGGKEGLYTELCQTLFRAIFYQFPVTRDFPENTSPEERLAFFVEGMLNRLLEQMAGEDVPKKSQLLARELAAPTKVMDSLVEEFVRPTSKILMEITRQILGPQVEEREVSKCLMSLVGQCFYYGLARPIFNRLDLLDLTEPGIIKDLAGHITRFSLAGMKAVREDFESKAVKSACSCSEGIK